MARVMFPGRVDRAPESRVAAGISAAAPSGDRDLLHHFREHLTAFRVLCTLAALDRRPFAVATHKTSVIQRNCLVFKHSVGVNKENVGASKPS